MIKNSRKSASRMCVAVARSVARASMAVLVCLCLCVPQAALAPACALADSGGNAAAAHLESPAGGGDAGDLTPGIPVFDTAPVFSAPEEGTLPDAVAGQSYWNAGANEPLVKFAAVAQPAAIYVLKDPAPLALAPGNPAAEGAGPAAEGTGPAAERAVDEFGDAYWTGAGLPAGLMLNELTGELIGVPEQGVQEAREVAYDFTVVARNAKGEDERAFTLLVTDESIAPAQPRMVEVPDLVAQGQSAAMRRLARAGFAARVKRQASERPAGEVIAQDPAAGTEAQLGAVVELTVSTGPETASNEPTIVTLDLYAYETDAQGAFLSRIGANGREQRDGAWWVPESLDQKGQRIRLSAAVQRSDGRSFYQNEDDWPDGISIQWQTSNAGVAVVTSTGVVVATGDGDCEITATEAGGARASMHVRVVGQAGRFPVGVDVIDTEGVAYGDERITYSKVDTPSLQLYARIAFNDGTTASNCPSAPDYEPEDETIATLSWSTTNTEKGYVNVETGVFVPRGYATLKAVAQVTGGDPEVSGGIVAGYVWIVIDSGEYAQANPSDELRVRVTYEADETHTAFERTFRISELRAIENAQATYTMTKDDGEYVTASARGIYLTTLLAHVRKNDGENGEGASLGIDPDDLYGMRLAANDGVNPGLITADFLFRARYYLPNYEFGANTADAVSVFPMFAYESDWRDSTRGARDAREDYSALDAGTRFRLMFGSVGTADGTTAKSLKYVNTVTFILKGAPPAQPENPEDPADPEEPEKPATPGGTAGRSGAADTGGQTDAAGTGDASPADSGGDVVSDAAGGTGASPTPVAGEAGAGLRNRTAGPKAALEAGGAKQAAAHDDPALSEADEQGAKEQSENGERGEQGDDTDNPHDFNVYQMMSNAKTNFQYEDWVNPYLPWVAPLFAAVAALGALCALTGFRRQLGGTLQLARLGKGDQA